MILRRTILLLWLGMLMATSASRVWVWQTNVTMWQDAVTKAPFKPRPLINYGEMLEAQGDLVGAHGYYERAFQAIHWRQDRRSQVSMFYAVQNLARNAILQGQQGELWALFLRAGCPSEYTVDSSGHPRVIWTCHTVTW
jgi:hypothetical protein